MNDMDEKQLIDDLEKESMLELEVMHESENTDNEKLLRMPRAKSKNYLMMFVTY